MANNVDRLYPLTGDIIRRGEELEDKLMDEFIKELNEKNRIPNQEALKVLETKWIREKHKWQSSIKKGMQPRYVLERFEKEHEEALKILETEWKDESSAWEAMLEGGHSAQYALSILVSFA